MLVRIHTVCINSTMHVSEIADPTLDLPSLKFVLDDFTWNNKLSNCDMINMWIVLVLIYLSAITKFYPKIYTSYGNDLQSFGN